MDKMLQKTQWVDVWLHTHTHKQTKWPSVKLIPSKLFSRLLMGNKLNVAGFI